MSEQEELAKERMEKTIQFAEETLSGDVRDTLLTHVRSMETPWSKLSQRDQEDKIDAIDRLAETVVRRAVSIIARRGFDLISVKIADFSVKGGAIKGKFEAIVSEPNVVALADHQSASAVLVLTDAADFIGERAAAKADPDQPAMFDDEDEAEQDADSEADSGFDDDDMPSVGDSLPPIPETPQTVNAD